MRVQTVNIGYREIDILSDLMHEIAKRGVSKGVSFTVNDFC